MFELYEYDVNTSEPVLSFFVRKEVEPVLLLIPLFLSLPLLELLMCALFHLCLHASSAIKILCCEKLKCLCLRFASFHAFP